MEKIVLITKNCPDYLSEAVSKLEKISSLKVNGLTVSELQKIEKEKPALFDKIIAFIKCGRWYPYAGLTKGGAGRISNERLAREILYSLTWLKEKTEMTFRVFFGKSICASSFPQIVYNGRFDCAVLEDETENYWLDGADRFRLFIMSEANTVDVAEITESDDFEYETYEELLHNTLSTPLDLNTVKMERTEDKLTQAEKAVILAEKASAQSGIDKSAEIRDCWFDIFDGNESDAEKKAKAIAADMDSTDIVKINNSDVKVNVFKFAEDGSGDIVIRLEETAGIEKNISVICDEINAGFRCEIEPYEIATYRVDSEGFVRETFIYE